MKSRIRNLCLILPGNLSASRDVILLRRGQTLLMIGSYAQLAQWSLLIGSDTSLGRAAFSYWSVYIASYILIGSYSSLGQAAFSYWSVYIASCVMIGQAAERCSPIGPLRCKPCSDWLWCLLARPSSWAAFPYWYVCCNLCSDWLMCCL